MTEADLMTPMRTGEIRIHDESGFEGMTQTVKEVNDKAGGKQMISECTIEIEGQDRPACVAETITVLYG